MTRIARFRFAAVALAWATVFAVLFGQIFAPHGTVMAVAAAVSTLLVAYTLQPLIRHRDKSVFAGLGPIAAIALGAFLCGGIYGLVEGGPTEMVTWALICGFFGTFVYGFFAWPLAFAAFASLRWAAGPHRARRGF